MVWLLVALNVSLGLGFGFSAYGLWRHYSWGRKIFLWSIAVWAGSNMVTIFIPGVNLQSSIGQQILNSLRYALALFVPIFYLNRTRIKMVFYALPKESNVKDLNGI